MFKVINNLKHLEGVEGENRDGDAGGVYIKKQATFTSSLQNANHKSNLISTNLT